MKAFPLSTMALSCLVGVTLGLAPVTVVAAEPVSEETASSTKAERKIKPARGIRKQSKPAAQTDQAATMTAIALAESRGSTQTPEPVLRATGRGPTRTDLRPWTVTHGSHPRYLKKQLTTQDLTASKSTSPSPKPTQTKQSQLKKTKPIR